MDVTKENLYFPLPVFRTAVVLFVALGVATFLFFSPCAVLVLLFPKNLLLMRIIFYKYKHLLQIKELKNKKAGPANHSLTTFLQKQGVKPYALKIVKTTQLPTHVHK